MASKGISPTKGIVAEQCTSVASLRPGNALLNNKYHWFQLTCSVTHVADVKQEQIFP
eukprot:m.111162 g.111162  ORF g.111162 m.111162 type:complete len:57 (+) comp14054_c0_seq6:4931-5101(+)